MKPTPTRVTEILESYLRALEAGHPPDREALLAQNPDVAEEVSAALEGLDFVHRATHSLTSPEGPDGVVAGKSLGDYRLVRELGRGGMAVVYEAEQISLERRVALKVLPFAAVLDPKQLQRFKNEALAAAQLHHPNIVPVYGVGCERGVHYYAMQYVEGQSLDRAIREMQEGHRTESPRTPLSSHDSNRETGYIRTVVGLGIQAAEALDHAHHLGIVHRDVKPANLLVDRAGTLWVTDFGLARTFRDAGLTMTGELLGTVRYMSPEQAHTKPLPIDHRTDVYSLGATLYELLTLQSPFPGDDPRAVIEDIASHEPVPPRRLNPSLPRDLETVLMTAMSKDPATRYATAQEMAADLRRVLDDRPVRARRPSLVARAGRWPRRHRGLMAATSALLLLGIAAVVVHQIRMASEHRKTRDALGLARKAVDMYLVEAGVADPEDHALFQAPANAALLQAALAFYEADVDDPDALHQRALIFHALSRYGDALAALDRILAIRPGDVRARESRADVLWHMGSPLAVEEVERLGASHPDPSGVHFFHGLALSDAGDFESAAEAFRQAIREDPNHVLAHHNLGAALANLGDREAAIREFREVLRLQPDSANARKELGLVLLDRGEIPEAIQVLREALRLRPGFGSARTLMAEALARSGELQSAAREHRDAIREHRETVARQPNNAVAHASLGFALVKAGAPHEAVKAFRESLRLRAGDAVTLTNFAKALWSAGERKEAVEQARRAVSQRRNAVLLTNLGNMLLQTDEVAEAIACFEEAISLCKEFAEAHACLGLARLMQDDPRGIGELREALKLDGKNHLTHRNLGLALSESGDWQAAILEEREAIRLKPDDAEAHFQLAVAYRNTGDLTSAIASYREAIRLDPEYAEAFGNLGSTLVLQGRLEEALALLRKCHEIGSKRPDWSYDSMERIRAAEQCLEIERQLDRVLAGESQPRNGAERADYALLMNSKSFHVTAAAMYSAAFAEEAALAGDLELGHRYDAACCAALAAARGGSLTAPWRLRALEWLRADLTEREKAGTELAEVLGHWKQDRDLASVRDRLEGLPEAEADSWREFWADVDSALARAAREPR